MSAHSADLLRDEIELNALRAILKRFQLHDYLHWKRSSNGSMLQLDFHAYPLDTHKQREILLDLYLRLVDITQDDRDRIEEETIAQMACRRHNIINYCIDITTKGDNQ